VRKKLRALRPVFQAGICGWALLFAIGSWTCETGLLPERATDAAPVSGRVAALALAGVSPLAASGSARSSSPSAFQPSSPLEFSRLLKETSGYFLKHRTADELSEILQSGGQLWVSPDHLVGFGLTGDGELISVFNLSRQAGRGAQAVRYAIELGARFLHCLEPLEAYYQRLGFVRDPDFAPQEIDVTRAARWITAGAQVPRRLRLVVASP
jgi:hypothetical protein